MVIKRGKASEMSKLDQALMVLAFMTLVIAIVLGTVAMLMDIGLRLKTTSQPFSAWGVVPLPLWSFGGLSLGLGGPLWSSLGRTRP